MSSDSQLLAAIPLALVELRDDVRALTKSVDEVRRRGSLPERTFALASKLQTTQALALAVSFAIVVVATAIALPIFVGGLILATTDPAAVLAFVAELFRLVPGV